MESTDSTLLADYMATHNADAFAALAHRHLPLVYGTCMRLLSNDADAQDVAQICFAELAKDPELPRCESNSLAGYLHNLARIRSLDALRRAGRREKQEPAAAPKADATREPTWDDIKTHIDAAIVLLPREMREPLLLHFFEKQTQAEVAERLGVEPDTVARRIDKALQLLRVCMENHFPAISVATLSALLADHVDAAAPSAKLHAAIIKKVLAGQRRIFRILSPLAIWLATIAITLIALIFIVKDILFPSGQSQAPISTEATTLRRPVQLADLMPGHAGNSYVVGIETIHQYLSPDKPIRYSRLMGLSGMAFIIQASPDDMFQGKVDVGWWPLDGWGFHLRTDFLGQGIGWHLQSVEGSEHELKSAPAAYYGRVFASQVRRSLLEGRPVLADHDMAFVIVEQGDGHAPPRGRRATDTATEPYAPDGDPPYPWGVTVFDHPILPMDARTADRQALRYALLLANDEVAVPYPNHFTGQKSWRAWSAFLRDTAKPTENRHHANMMLHLQLQRAAAVGYLRDAALHFHSQPRDYLLKAAAQFDDLQRELSESHVGDVENSAESRRQLANMVDQWAAQDAAAFREIGAALK